MCSNESAATLPDQPSENHSLLLPGHPQAGTRLTVLSDLHFAAATSLPAIAIRRKREKQSNGWDRHVTLFPAMKPRRVDKHGRVPLNLFTKEILNYFTNTNMRLSFPENTIGSSYRLPPGRNNQNRDG